LEQIWEVVSHNSSKQLEQILPCFIALLVVGLLFKIVTDTEVKKAVVAAFLTSFEKKI
jgi:hypothetical protein